MHRVNSYIPRHFIDELLSRTNVVELIGDYIPLHKTGINFSARCPFHEEKTPSFSVSPSKQFFYCFGCGISGNAINFLMNFNHTTFVETIEILAQRAGLPIPTEAAQKAVNPNKETYHIILQKASHFYQTQLRTHPEAHKAVAYLKQRGITGGIAKKFQLGYAPPGWNSLIQYIGASKAISSTLETVGLVINKDHQHYYDRFRDRIIYPICDRTGKTIGFGGRVLDDSLPKYLNSPETPMFQKGRELYGLHVVIQEIPKKKIKSILVVEGYMDVLALAQYDIIAVATLGTATTEEHFKLLFRYVPEIIFCFDGDIAGQKAAERAIEIGLQQMREGRQIRFMFLPATEDPDSFIRSQGKTLFLANIEKAISITECFFNQLFDTKKSLDIAARADIAEKGAKILNKIPNGLFKQMMFEELAKRLQLDHRKLYKPTVYQNKIEPFQITPVRRVIALLLQDPELIHSVPIDKVIQLPDFPDFQLLCQVIQYIQQNPSMNTGQLIEHWRQAPEESTIMRLAMLPFELSPEGIKIEFLAAITTILKQNKQQLLETLLSKAKKGEITSEEKHLMQQLIVEEKNNS